MSQNEEVIQYMKQFGSITPMDAVADLGCMRLSARIWDIEHMMGIPVKRETVFKVNRKGKKVYFTRYSLQGGAE